MMSLACRASLTIIALYQLRQIYYKYTSYWKKNCRNGVFKYTASFFFFVIIVSISFMYTANGKRQIQVENFTK